MAAPILLILGAGPGIGAHVAKAFAAKGYKVALASRSAKADVPDTIHISVDLNKPETIAAVFETTREKLGAYPSVVVYNGAKYILESRTNPLSTPALTLPNILATYNINAISPVIAAQAAIKCFQTLPSTASKTFIYTGNILNVVPVPGLGVFGASKGAMAYLIRCWAEMAGYGKDGISFYYADERQPSGAPMYDAVSGPAAAEAYLELSERQGQEPWLYTFVHGQGYKDFGVPKL